MNMLKSIKKLFHGAICFVEKEGYVIPRRFTLEQTDSFRDKEFFLHRTYCGASITLELETEATYISFSYKFFLRTGVNSTFEIYTNGFLTHLARDSELQDEGTLKFDFKEGYKKIEIYIPNYSETGIKDFYVNGTYKVIPKKRTKVLFIGDSITQGGGSERSGCTYVNIVKRALNYEIVNWGIGGYIFDDKIIQRTEFKPNKIIVAMGTNNRSYSFDDNKKAIERFFEKINTLYPNIPVLAIVPQWVGTENEKHINTYRQIKPLIEQTVLQYPQMQSVSAYDMIPHFSEYFMNDLVHPNSLGMEAYGSNLVNAIKKRGF